MLESSLKDKSRSHFFKDIFQLPDSKSLGLRSAAFEMQLIHGAWGSLLKRPLLSKLKQFLVFSEK